MNPTALQMYLRSSASAGAGDLDRIKSDLITLARDTPSVGTTEPSGSDLIVGQTIWVDTNFGVPRVKLLRSIGTPNLWWIIGGNLPLVYIYKLATQSVGNNAWQSINFAGGGDSVEASDSDGFHDGSGANPERITIPAGMAGYYHLQAKIEWQANSAGHRGVMVMVNGLQLDDDIRAANDITGVAGAITTPVRVNVDYFLVPGDNVWMNGFQTSGAPLNAVGSTFTYLSAQYIRPGP
jgi:hypothetical protein